MGKFDELYKAAEALKGDRLIERIERGYPVLSDAVNAFMKAVHGFHMANPEYGLGDYFEILEQNGFSGGSLQFDSEDVDSMDARCIMAMLVFFTRAYHHSMNDMIVDYIKNGVVEKAMARLKELEAGEKAPGPKPAGRFDALFEAADALEGDKYLEKGDDGDMYYTEAVNRFFDEVDRFFSDNPGFDPWESRDILMYNGFENVYSFDLSDKDEHCVMALLKEAMFNERFHDFLLSTLCEEGVVQKAVARLRELESEKAEDAAHEKE